MTSFFLLVIMLVLPDQAVPVAVSPFETQAACEAVLAGKEWHDAQKNIEPGTLFVAECLPIRVAEKKIES